MTSATALNTVRGLARLMDSAVQVPGTNVRLGLDALIGLLPVVGDVIGAAVGSYIVAVAARLGVPRPVLARMALNVAVDALIGAIPLLGDLFDLGWRANVRNVNLLERALESPAAATRASIGILVALSLGLVLFLVGSVALVAWVVEGLT